MFKGTSRRTAFDVNRDFDEMGATYNAFTSEENTVYFAAVLSEFQTQVLDVLCDILRPALRQKDFDVEKNVIIDEIARYEDMPKYRTYENLMGKYFQGHPLGNRVLGTAESISAMKRDGMQAYFDSRYSPGNIIVVGAGNLNYETFMGKISQDCLNWQPCQAERKTSRATGIQQHKLITDKKLARQHLGIMSSAPPAQDDMRYAAQLLATIVGDVTGSRLFYSLIEPAIADEASMAYDPFDGEGAFLTFISTDPDKATDAHRITKTVFEKFLAEGPTDTELLAAKNKIASAATLKGELPMGRLTSLGFDWVYRKKYVPLAEQIETLLAVSKNDVLELARQYDLTAFTSLALGPCDSI